jgi:hypothetical protein
VAERRLDHQLGLRPRDERARVDPEAASVELLHADEVRGRLPVRAPLQEQAVSRQLRLRERLVEVEVQPQALAA